MYDIIIIGAGPAGLTSAIYARRAMKKVLVLEKLSYGGQIINTLDIENYPANYHISGFDLAKAIYDQAKDLGAEIKFEEVLKIENSNVKKVITAKGTYEAKAIIIATGSFNNKLGLENEDKLTGKGISYCATCDGAFYKGEDVAVVGGGEVALKDALYLSDIASKVYLIHRRDKFKADESLINNLKEKENIKIIYNSTVTKLIGSDKLEKIEIADKDLNKKSILVSGLFVAVGRTPSSDICQDLVDVDKNGYVVATENGLTKTPGIFVAGDVRTKNLRQLVTATSDGANAAIEAIKYIN